MGRGEGGGGNVVDGKRAHKIKDGSRGAGADGERNTRKKRNS